MANEVLYVVVGSSGSYSDYCTGIFGIFSRKEDAETYVQEEMEWNEFIRKMNIQMYQIIDAIPSPRFPDGPEWGYQVFKKTKIAPLATEKEWLELKKENRVALGKRNALYQEHINKVAAAKAAFWLKVFNENPRWHYYLKDTTGNNNHQGWESYSIEEHKVDALLGLTKP